MLEESEMCGLRWGLIYVIFFLSLSLMYEYLRGSCAKKKTGAQLTKCKTFLSIPFQHGVASPNPMFS